jgi:hypothetical protein
VLDQHERQALAIWIQVRLHGLDSSPRGSSLFSASTAINCDPTLLVFGEIPFSRRRLQFTRLHRDLRYLPCGSVGVSWAATEGLDYQLDDSDANKAKDTKAEKLL